MNLTIPWRSRRDETPADEPPGTHTIPGPPRHRGQPRKARSGSGPVALRTITAEDPVQPQCEPYTPPPFSDAMHRWLEDRIETCRQRAHDRRSEAARQLDLAQADDFEADEWERMRWLADTVPGAPESDAPQGPGRGGARSAGQCFDCGTLDGTVRSFNALEGRDVPLCPRCHPSADEADDAGADGEEPEWVEPTTAHAGKCCCADCESEAYKDHAHAHAEDLPEGVAGEPAPVSGPAVVPQFQSRRDATVPLPVGWWERPDDTLTRLDLDGVER